MNKHKITIKVWTGLLVLVFFNYDMAFAYWPDHGMMGTGMGWMMLLFWGLLLGVLILVTRWVSNLPQGEMKSAEIQKSAMEILKERFVKGEINIIEYESKKKAISD